MAKGSGRDQGYASSDEEGNLTYTSYEKNGSVNRYKDNGDGGHSHEHWRDKDSYNSGKNPDSSRQESNNSSNPSTGEIQDNRGCFLTSACMNHFQNLFDDSCYELRVLRWFRDNFISREDVIRYYEIAPIIVSAIDSIPNSHIAYDYIFDNIVDYCVIAIEDGKYDLAYNRYKNSILSLEINFVKKEFLPKPIKSFTKVKNLINI